MKLSGQRDIGVSLSAILSFVILARAYQNKVSEVVNAPRVASPEASVDHYCSAVLKMGANELKADALLQSKPDFSPSTDVWYSDGSVVLVAEKTAFRVHGTILAAHCEIFKDMFAIPQPFVADPDAETYESCQVLRLQDSPVDLKHFLKSIYDFS